MFSLILPDILIMPSKIVPISLKPWLILSKHFMLFRPLFYFTICAFSFISNKYGRGLLCLLVIKTPYLLRINIFNNNNNNND